MTQEMFTIAKIVNAQGVKGEIRAVPMTDFPERFDKMKTAEINLDGKLVSYPIEWVRPHGKNLIVLKLKGIDDMNAALLFKNGLIQVTRAGLVPLPEGRYYIFDLLGLPVYSLEGELLGHLVDVFQTGSNDVFTVKTPEGKEVLLPNIPQVIKEINPQEKKIMVELMEGLI